MRTRFIIFTGLSSLFFFFCCPSVFAGGDYDSSSYVASQVEGYYMKKQVENHGCHDCWFLGAGAAYSSPDLQNSSVSVLNGSSFSTPYNTDLYSINTSNSDELWSFYAGYRWKRSETLFPKISLALRYQHLDSFNISGTIDQYSLPGYVNYNYSLNGTSNVLTIFSKFDIYQFYCFAPYFSMGAGLARNEVENYNEQAYSGIYPRVSPAYADLTQNNLTYDIGLGLDCFLNHGISMSLGYEYANLGTMKTGNGASTWSGSSLSFGTLTAQSVLFNIFYQLP